MSDCISVMSYHIMIIILHYIITISYYIVITPCIIIICITMNMGEASSYLLVITELMSAINIMTLA